MATKLIPMESRLDDLEIRQTHQELALEQLTHSHLELRRQLEQVQAELNYMKSLLRELSPSAVAPPGEETPPPHY